MSVTAKRKRKRKAHCRLKPTEVVPSNGHGRARGAVEPNSKLPALISELRALQRQRAVYVKSMNMVGNRLQAIVAGTLGYHSGLKENERKTLFGKAAALIKRIVKDGEDHELAGIMLAHNESIEALRIQRKMVEAEMVRFAKQLPIAEWVQAPEQRGFGLLFLAIVIGEAGDLSNYANPGKVWRRFGCAPYTKDNETLMGATWRSRGKKPGVTKLSSEDWEDFGYSPRRRSIAYLIGEGLVKQNFVVGEHRSETEVPVAGPYRQRYDTKKAEAAENHPDWKPLRCHLHGMLLAAKLLLKNLWIEWRRYS